MLRCWIVLIFKTFCFPTVVDWFHITAYFILTHRLILTYFSLHFFSSIIAGTDCLLCCMFLGTRFNRTRVWIRVEKFKIGGRSHGYVDGIRNVAKEERVRVKGEIEEAGGRLGTRRVRVRSSGFFFR